MVSITQSIFHPDMMPGLSVFTKVSMHYCLPLRHLLHAVWEPNEYDLFLIPNKISMLAVQGLWTCLDLLGLSYFYPVSVIVQWSGVYCLTCLSLTSGNIVCGTGLTNIHSQCVMNKKLHDIWGWSRLLCNFQCSQQRIRRKQAVIRKHKYKVPSVPSDSHEHHCPPKKGLKILLKHHIP